MCVLVLTALLMSRSKLIGHIHVAKTGGTFLNELLANNYHFVCGHKGYSFDYYQANARAAKTNQSSPGHVRDSIHAQFDGFDRTKVPFSIMEERGFESCKWVSIEGHMALWHHFDTWPEPVELHLPCRDPLEHFMSQVNYRRDTINCETFRLENTHRYLVGMNRFAVADIPRNATLRCVHFSKQFSEYVTTIALPPKSVAMRSKLHALRTNRPRNRAAECIWQNRTLQRTLVAHLVQNYEYYQYCSTCRDWVV